MADVQAVLARLRVEPRIESEPLLRAMLLCYLVDWKNVLEHGKQLTDLEWQRAGWGPYSPSLVTKIINLHNSISSNRPHHMDYSGNIEQESLSIVDDIREKYFNSSISHLSNLVMSTYPMMYGASSDGMDLVSLGEIYKTDFESDRKRVKEKNKIQVSLD